MISDLGNTSSWLESNPHRALMLMIPRYNLRSDGVYPFNIISPLILSIT